MTNQQEDRMIAALEKIANSLWSLIPLAWAILLGGIVYILKLLGDK